MTGLLSFVSTCPQQKHESGLSLESAAHAPLCVSVAANEVACQQLPRKDGTTPSVWTPAEASLSPETGWRDEKREEEIIDQQTERGGDASERPALG